MSKNIFTLFFIFCTFTSILNAQNDETVSNIHEQIISNLIESSVSFRNSDKKLSIEICEKAIKLAEKEQADSLLALAFKTQGVNYYYAKDFGSCMFYWEKALVIFKELGNMIQVGKTLGNIGVIYKRRGEYDKTLECYLEEIKVFKEINHTAGLTSIYLNLGGLFVTLEDFENAENNFQKALVIADQNNNDGEKVKALNNLGVLYEKQDKLEEALETYEKSLSLVVNSENSVMKSKLYLNIGIIHRRMKDFHRASEFLDKSFEIRKLRGDYEELLGVYNEKFQLALCMEKYISAKLLVDTMQDLAEINSDSKWRIEAYRAYTDFYKSQGDYKLAFDSYENFLQLKDSIHSALNDDK